MGLLKLDGVFLSRDYWGGCYNRKFKTLMVSDALRYFEFVIFYVNPKNYRSQRALKKLGAKRMAYPEKLWVLEESIGVTYATSIPSLKIKIHLPLQIKLWENFVKNS